MVMPGTIIAYAISGLSSTRVCSNRRGSPDCRRHPRTTFEVIVKFATPETLLSKNLYWTLAQWPFGSLSAIFVA